MDTKYKKLHPRDLYLIILNTEVSKADLWTGRQSNQ